jgi:hypothetical protein
LKGLFDSGDPTKSSFNFSRTFSAGTFSYRCEVHSDMTGKIKTKLLVFEDSEGGGPTVQWATGNSETGNRFDVQYKVESGDWKNWVKNTDDIQRVFGEGNSPVELDLGTTYRFRARSQKGTEDSKVSGWSPGKPFFYNPT